MTVYVDDMAAAYGRMKMCHMLADTDEELHAMADRIGVQRKWHQAPPRHDSHYDIALSKRALAVAAGAVQITWRQASAMTMRRRLDGVLGEPDQSWDGLMKEIERRAQETGVRPTPVKR